MKNKKLIVLLGLLFALCLFVAGGWAKGVPGGTSAVKEDTTASSSEDQNGSKHAKGTQGSLEGSSDGGVTPSKEGPSTQCLEESCGGCDRLTHCKPCFGFEMDKDAECSVTGSKHRVMCLKSKEKKFVACDPAAEDTRQETLKFWVFQFIAAVSLIVGKTVARLRQRVHEKKALKKMQKHIEA